MMPKPPTLNRRIVLNARPQGLPKSSDLALVEDAMPSPAEGQVLLRTLYLSLDPYMRGRMNDGPSYAAPVKLGETMGGGTVSVVEQSRFSGLVPGDVVLGYCGWQAFAVTDGASLTKLDMGKLPLSLALGVLGMPGFTAYMGLLDIGAPMPGETVVVAAASGAVGATVGQIARIKGCRVVGIAGGAAKCAYVRDGLKFDTCIDHTADDFADQLAGACSRGIDVYFENVGGKVFDAVMPLLNTSARVPVCGLIADYNRTALPPGPDRLGLLMRLLLTKRIRMQGFIISQDYGDRLGEFLAAMRPWVESGAVKYREDVVSGLEQAPQAFIGLLQGKNFGKLVVRVSDL
jgi:NADPH-dependent curcumin reductase CurA